jgi:hypothetical protein
MKTPYKSVVWFFENSGEKYENSYQLQVDNPLLF